MIEIIGKLITIKDRVAAADTDQILPHYLPELGATSDDIHHLEEGAGFALSNSYRSFLLAANGWRCVLVRIDLLGTNEILARQQAVIGHSEFVRALYEHGISSSFLVIGVSDPDDNICVIDSEGRVHWYVHGDVESFENFSTFMLTLLTHNEELLQEMTDGRWRL